MKKAGRLAYVISDVDRWAQFEWTAQGLREEGLRPVYFILNPLTSHFESFLREEGFEVVPILCRGYRDFPLVYLKLVSGFLRYGVSVVHTHFLKASLLGLVAAKSCGIPKRVMTRHHGDFHHQFARKGVLLDRLCNALATDIIVLSESHKKILIEKEKVFEQKLHLVPHGMEVEAFAKPQLENVKILKRKYSIPEGARTIGMVARLIQGKGYDTILPVMKQIMKQYPHLHFIIANFRGPEKERIQRELKGFPEGRVHTIEFEKDLYSLYHLFDVFIHCPESPSIESFGQVYIEAAAAARPMIITRSGIANDCLTHKEDCLVVHYNDPQSLKEAIKQLLDNYDWAIQLGQKAQENIQERYSVKKMVNQLKKIYVLDKIQGA